MSRKDEFKMDTHSIPDSYVAASGGAGGPAFGAVYLDTKAEPVTRSIPASLDAVDRYHTDVEPVRPRQDERRPLGSRLPPKPLPLCRSVDPVAVAKALAHKLAHKLATRFIDVRVRRCDAHTSVDAFDTEAMRPVGCVIQQDAPTCLCRCDACGLKRNGTKRGDEGLALCPPCYFGATSSVGFASIDDPTAGSVRRDTWKRMCASV